MTLVYEQSGEFKGVPTYRFVAPKTLFANGTDYPPNEGFCPCRQSGIQNVSTCRLSECSPVVPPCCANIKSYRYVRQAYLSKN